MKSNLPTENCDCPVTSGHARNIHFICKVSRNVTSGYLFKKKCITKTLMSDYSPNAYFKVICGTIAHVYMWFCEFSFFVFFFVQIRGKTFHLFHLLFSYQRKNCINKRMK